MEKLVTNWRQAQLGLPSPSVGIAKKITGGRGLRSVQSHESRYHAMINISDLTPLSSIELL